MKNRIASILILSAFAFAGCDTTTGQLTPQGQLAVTTGLGIAEIALASYGGYAAATAGGAKVTPATYTTLAQNALYGVAALAQANVGKTPAAANIAAGAGNSVAGSAVQAAIPQTPITQATVQTLFDAAAKVPTVAPPTSASRRLRTLYYGNQVVRGAVLRGGGRIVYSVPQ